MATQTTNRRFNPSEIATLLGIAVVLGVGIPYAVTRFKSDDANKAPTAAPARGNAPPPAPPKIDFVEAGTIAGTQSSFTKGDLKATADMAVDDASIYWLKVETPAAAGGQKDAGAGGRGGGGGGRRGRGLPLTITDSDKQEYSYSVERKDGGLMALHLKKGYSKKPDSLTVNEMQGDKAVGTWTIRDIPAPTLLVPDASESAKPIGEIQLKPGRRGRLGASVHLTEPFTEYRGVILTPIAASFTPIDTSRDGSTIISRAGVSPFDAPINMPNPKMAKRVSFDMQTYEGTVTTETVTFHSARIEAVFGQPTLVVDKDEIAKTASGISVSLIKQNDGPRREPRKIHPNVGLRVLFDTKSLSGAVVSGLAPSIGAELVSPKPADLGLEHIQLAFSGEAAIDGEHVFDVKTPAQEKALAGTAKIGPIPALILKLTIVRPKVGSKTRIVLPVNPKVFPADAAGGGAGLAGANPHPV